jgi:phosphotransferase system enzyme I (PtsI)
VRAVRLCLAHPELFKTQLRAILRAAVDFPVKVMYPMIAAVEEWQAAARLLAEARDELRGRGNPAPDRIDAGIMVEIPSTALCATRFADEVDFFSIGTNDLVQYTLAAERGNPALAGLADGFHPAVLELIYRVAEAAHARGKWAGVCGEMAGDPLAAPVLVGLGIDELSMNAPAIPRIKQVIRFSDYSLLRGRAVELLTLPTAQAVRKAAALLFAPGVNER